MKGKKGFRYKAAAAVLLSLCLYSAFLFLGRSEASFADYEFERIREAYKLKKIAFRIHPQLQEYWEGEKELGPQASAGMERALISKKGNFESNPFYHLLLGETYSRSKLNQKAQDEWARADALAKDDLFLHWLLLQELCLKGHSDQARTEIQEIKRIQKKAGPRRLPFLASQAVRLAEQLKDHRPLNLALELATLALYLDPRSVEAHYLRASLLWKEGRSNIGNVLKEILSGTITTLKEEREVYTLAANLISAAALAYFVLFLMLGATLFLKYEPLLRHELTERMKITLIPQGRVPLFGFLCLIPIFLFLGWGWLLFFWVLLIFPYCRWKERAILTLLILLLLALPFFYRYAASMQIAGNDPLMEAVTQVEEGLQGKDAANFLARNVADHPEDSFSHFYYGLLLKAEEGRLEKAEREFQAYLARFPNHGSALNNLGNIYLLQKRYEEAEIQYKKAIEADSKVASTHANLSLLYAYFPQRLRIEEAQAEFSKAEKLEPGITARIESYQEMPWERCLIYQNLPRREIWEKILAPSEERDLLAEALWGERIRFLSLKSLSLFPFIVAFLFWISFWLRARGPNARFCEKCGKDICDLCEKKALRAACCSACYAIFYSREGVSPQVRIEKLVWKDRHGELEKMKVRILSLFPGAASFYSGRSWVGLAHSAIFLLLLGYWAKWSEITPMTSPFSHHFPLLWGVAFLTPLLILYTASVIRGLKWSA